MVPEILDGLMWMMRAGVRAGDLPAWSGHAYADAAFRPARVPFVSVLGPTSLDVEPDRALTLPEQLLFQLPGFIYGAERADADVLPAAGALRLRVDADVTVSIALAGLPVGPVPAGGSAVATAIQQAFETEAWVVEGDPIDDATRARLRGVTARWDANRRRLVVASGSHGVVDGPRPSSVEVLPVAVDLAPALGLDAPTVQQTGRTYQHALTAPRAMAVDLRLDLWAGEQRQLGAMIDTFARLVPKRGHFVTRPSLLAEPVEIGDTSVRLLAPGEPSTHLTILHLEGPDGFVDRRSGQTLETTPPGLAAAPTALLGAGESARLRFNEQPLVPDPRRAAHPFRRGLAASVRLELPGANDDERFSVLTVRDADARLALGMSVATPPGQAVIEVSTERVQPDDTVAAVTVTATIPRADLAGALHVVVPTGRRPLQVYLDGRPLIADPPAAPDGVLPGSFDMQVELGGGNPSALRIDALHLVAQPRGPLDPRFRAGAHAADRFEPGDPFGLSFSEDGHTPSAEAFNAVVVGVEGDRVYLDRPSDRVWRPGTTLGFSRAYFFKQKQIRRKDDLMNHLFRLCGDYRVSALLDEDQSYTSQPLAEQLRVNVHTRSRSLARPGRGAPGVSAQTVPARLRSSEPATDEE